MTNKEDFYLQLKIIANKKINNNVDTIIFLDEIQTYPHLISLLKPSKEDNKYRYIASGSSLGITLKHIFSDWINKRKKIISIRF